MTATDSGTASPGTDVSGTPRQSFGVDVGGSGIKGGIVDLDTGQLIGDRFKLLTPHPATPSAVAKTIAAIVNEFKWTGPLGVTYPGVVTNGTVRTAANVDKKWIGTDARQIIGAELDGQKIAVLNDADATGLAKTPPAWWCCSHSEPESGRRSSTTGYCCPTPSSATSRSAAKKPNTAPRRQSGTSAAGATKSGLSR